MASAGPLPSDIQPVANETRDRIITGLVTIVPFVAIVFAGWQVWGRALHWSDIFLFVGIYLLTGLGITVGFHRHLTHRAFKTHSWLHGLLAILGSAAIEGPVISWVDRTFLLWAILGLLIPFALGWVIGGTVFAGVTGLLWGGLVRVFVLHHFTYSINSLCHVFGKREFESSDHSRNLALIAIPTLGEAFHNSHHAFPTSATHGLRWWQVDVSAIVIDSLEKVNLVWDVVRVSPERLAAKAVS
jgi:stearoyl-CoA desaturase (delta-9 desaturase)